MVQWVKNKNNLAILCKVLKETLTCHNWKVAISKCQQYVKRLIKKVGLYTLRSVLLSASSEFLSAVDGD